MNDLTPVESHEGILLKREDKFTMRSGVNGGKLRACQHLIEGAKLKGFKHVVSAASVLSPQSAMAAVVAANYGMECTVVVGGSRPDTVLRHKAMQVASANGAEFEFIRVGYNPQLQKYAREMASQTGYTWQLPYGITPPIDSTPEEVRAFHAVGAEQVRNLPDTLETLVIPFGSGNSAASVLYGLSQKAPTSLQRIILMGIGPDKRDWLGARLAQLGAVPPVKPEYVALYPDFAKYGHSMRAKVGDVVMHPTYEGKIVRWCNLNDPEWWTKKDEKTCLWVVGGPLK